MACYFFSKLYTKKLLKYFGIYIMLLLMIIPLFFQANLLAKKLTINNVNTKLSQGIDDFESQTVQTEFQDKKAYRQPLYRVQ